MADFSNTEVWDPSSVSSENLGDGPPAVGSLYRVVSRFLGSETELVYEIVELDRPRRVKLRAETDAITSIDEISFRRGGDGDTEITYDADLTLKGPRRLLDLPFRLAFRRLCERARERMTEVLAK